jgi:hypothetical protein
MTQATEQYHVSHFQYRFRNALLSDDAVYALCHSRAEWPCSGFSTPAITLLFLFYGLNVRSLAQL